MLIHLADATNINGIEYDPKSKRYRIVSGSGGKGQFISKAAFLNQAKKRVVSESQALVDLAAKVADKSLSLRDFQLQAAKHLKSIHVTQAILGKNGVENIKAEDWLKVGRELKRQYYSGIDPITGKRFGLKHLVADIKAGKVSQAQLKARLKLYAQSGKTSYWTAKVDHEGGYGFRELGKRDRNNCPECVELASRGAMAASALVLPGQQCRCRSNCRCRLKLYATLEEAIGALPTAS